MKKLFFLSLMLMLGNMAIAQTTIAPALTNFTPNYYQAGFFTLTFSGTCPNNVNLPEYWYDMPDGHSHIATNRGLVNEFGTTLNSVNDITGMYIKNHETQNVVALSFCIGGVTMPAGSGTFNDNGKIFNYSWVISSAFVSITFF